MVRGGSQKFRGKPLVFRESQYGAKNFKANGAVYTNNALVPKPKFLFFVKFHIANSAARSSGSEDNIKKDIVFQIKQIDKPKFNIQTETMNQYNKKRVIQSSIEYNPMTINFHDDVGDKVLKFWADYFDYYYGDGGRSASSDWKNDIVERDFFHGQKDGWGYQGKFAGGSSNMHFLEDIELIQFYGGLFTSMKFVRPIITVFDHDNNDYAEGREGTGIRISFDYEGVIYNLEDTPVEGHEDEYGFLQDYYDPDTPNIAG